MTIRPSAVSIGGGQAADVIAENVGQFLLSLGGPVMSSLRLLITTTVVLVLLSSGTTPAQNTVPASRALEILARARQEARLLQKDLQDRMLGEISVGLAQAGDLKGARQTAREISAWYVRQEAVTRMAAVLREQGQLESARTLLRDFAQELSPSDISVDDLSFLSTEAKAAEQKKHAAGVLKGIAAAQVELGDNSAALETCRRALEMLEGLKFTEVARRDIAVVQASAGDAEGAYRIGQSIEERFDRMQAFGLIAKAQAESDRWEAALDTQERFEGAYVWLFADVAAAQVRTGNFERARQTVMALRAEAVEHEPGGLVAGLNRGLDGALANAAVALLERGDEQAANAALDLIQEENKPLALLEIAQQHEDAGKLESALELRQSVSFDKAPPGRRARLSDQNAARIAHLKAQLGDLGGAVRTARTITDPLQQVYAWSQLAQIQESSGDQSAAAASLKQATEALAHIDEPNRPWLTATIAVAYAETGDSKTSLEIARDLLDMHGALQVIRTLAKSTAERDGLDRALELVNSLQSPFEKASALVGIAERVLEE